MALINKLALLFGPLLLTGGILNYLLTPFFIRLISERLLRIEKGTVFYEKWIKTPVPLDVKIYVFDVRNPKEIMKGALPIVKEIGPFSFSETREKKILKYSSDKETVSYMENKIFKFNPEKSVDDLSRHFVTLNVAFLSAIKIWNENLKNFPLSFVVQPVAERLLSTIMEYYQQNLFINVTVDQIMFKGVHVNFVPLLQSIAQIFERFGVGNEIKALSNSTFAYYKYINNTWSGPYEVYTGYFGLSKLGQLKGYKGKSVLDLWTDQNCNTVHGSDGIQFTPLKNEKSPIYVFTHEFCRSITMQYQRDSSVRGIKTYRYEPSDDLFMKKNRNNKCDCSDSYLCKYNGIVDLSPCWFKSPLYGSVPHFAGDQFAELRKSIKGLKPDVSKHKSFLDLDPVTGSSLRGSKRGQLNAYIEKISSIRSTRSVKDDLFIPLFWYEERGEINEQLEEEIKMRSVYPLIVTNYLLIISLVVGSIFSLISCIFCLCCRKRQKKKVQTSLTNELYLDQNYEKLTNLDDAQSTKTHSTDSSKHTNPISIISNDSLNSSKKPPGFILVQPIQYDKSLPEINNNNNIQHSLAQLQLVPFQQHSNYNKKFMNDEEHMNLAKFKSSLESNNNLPLVQYRAPSPETLNESMKIISKLIEMNSFMPNHSSEPIKSINQQDRSLNEMTVNQRKTKLTKQFSSQDSFD